MQKILIATRNDAKFGRYKRVLNRVRPNIEILSPAQLNIDVKVEEIGESSEEIAKHKALQYLNYSSLPSLAIDEECYVEGVPDEMQPGIHVRRIGGREVTDIELLNFFFLNYMGKWANWTFSHVLALSPEKIFLDKAVISAYLYMRIQPGHLIKGYPLSSLLYDVKLGKYWIDLTEEEERIVLQPVYKSIERILNKAFEAD